MQTISVVCQTVVQLSGHMRHVPMAWWPGSWLPNQIAVLLISDISTRNNVIMYLTSQLPKPIDIDGVAKWGIY